MPTVGAMTAEVNSTRALIRARSPTVKARAGRPSPSRRSIAAMRASKVPERVVIRPLAVSACRISWFASRFAMSAL